MKKLFIVILLLGALIVLYLIYTKYIQLERAKLIEQQTREQRMLIEAQTAGSIACSKNWMCATQNVLGGIGGIFNNMF